MSLRHRLGAFRARGGPPDAAHHIRVTNEGPLSLPSHLPSAPPDNLLVSGPRMFGDPTIKWHWGDRGLCRVGNYTSFAEGCTIYVGGEHRTDWSATFAFREVLGLPGRYEGDPLGLPHSKGDVVIGSDVWVAAGVTILSGVTIGDGAVVGCRSVVAADVPPYAIVGGNPARMIRYRFDVAEREAFLRIKWWDWPEAMIVDELDLLQSTNVALFLAKHDQLYRNGQS